jgi:LmbE family N-acetylglucosaminyl deacetylase
MLWMGLPSSVSAQVLVVSPHPDDDIIMASGVVKRAVARGETVYIVYVTNGDFFGQSTGTLRQGEAVNAQALLGVDEDHLIFLGYPDGSVFVIRDRFRFPGDYPDPGGPFVSQHGISATYASRGLGRTDYHRHRFGTAGSYRWETAIGDMVDILNTIRPAHIFTTSQWDTHNDHEATYFLVRDALLQANGADPTYNPTIHKTTVWPGDTSWPAPLDPTSYFTEIPKPPFNNRWGLNPLTWPQRESLDVPSTMQSPFFPSNPKYGAVDAHASQDGTTGYIGRWVHKDEFFWTEQVAGANRPPVPNAGTDQQANEGVMVTLNGTASFDPDGTALTYSWRQVSGPSVTLSNPTLAQPTYISPSGLAADVMLEFELVVSDGALTTVPDGVRVLARSAVPPPQYGLNVAALATIAASSERASSGQTAAKVADGSPLGYPTDATHEWATAGEGVGAWISMTWASPVVIGKIVLYDRPNASDQLTAGVITFSDGSTLPIGPLSNGGQAVEYVFAPRTVTSLRLDVSQVGPATGNVGLAEFAVFELAGINRPPVARAGSDQIVAGGAPVGLNGSTSSDPDNDPLTYAWTQVAGTPVVLSSASTAMPTFVAPPALPGSQLLRFELVVTDGTLASVPDTVDVLILGTVNQPPTANAGPDATVSAGSTVTLNGTGSTDPEGQAVTYEWSQTAGTPVALTGSTTSGPSFVLPVTALDGVLTFQLVVRDGLQASIADTVQITVIALPSTANNLSPSAVVTASSQRAPLQSAAKAVDGFADGYPTDSSHEWATVAQRDGAWIQLQWSAAHTITRIRLHDRPNTDDRVLSGLLTFGDGSSVPVGPLSNDGTGVDILLSPRQTNWVRFTVTATSASTFNIGLAEILVFEQEGTTANQAPIAVAGPSQTVDGGTTVALNGTASSDPEGATLTFAWTQISGPAVVLSNPATAAPIFTAPPAIRQTQVLVFNLAVHDGVSATGATTQVTVRALPNFVPVANAGPDQNVSAGAAVQLDGRSSSDADGDPLTYQWTQTAGAPVTLTGATTAQPSFTAPPALSNTQQLVFQLVVGDGVVSSAADAVTVTIPGQPDAANIARVATVTASSQTSALQAAVKAVDGVTSGYPAMPGAEWATASERAGAWIQLDWASDQIVSRIRLYDRPNADDQITAATLLFADGSSIAIGPLPNDGSGAEIVFSPRTIRWVRLRVDGVSRRTSKVGLSEFEVFSGQ